MLVDDSSAKDTALTDVRKGFCARRLSPSSACPETLRDRVCASMSYTMILPRPAPATTSLPSAENRIDQIWNQPAISKGTMSTHTGHVVLHDISPASMARKVKQDVVGVVLGGIQHMHIRRDRRVYHPAISLVTPTAYSSITISNSLLRLLVGIAIRNCPIALDSLHILNFAHTAILRHTPRAPISASPRVMLHIIVLVIVFALHSRSESCLSRGSHLVLTRLRSARCRFYLRSVVKVEGVVLGSSVCREITVPAICAIGKRSVQRGPMGRKRESLQKRE